MNARSQRLELNWYNKDKALIPTEFGRYGYTWVDPRDPRYCETRPLAFDDYVEGKQSPKEDGTAYSERADYTPTTDNLLITGESGDVLEALTRVPELTEKYVGQVKLIYIDPPFNTSQAFSNYEDNLEHSIWLTMMRDRLIHMRSLLSSDGSIWVHLDEAETHRMHLLLDEVFGAANFVAKIAWQKQYGPDNRSVFTQTDDSILVYARRYEAFKSVRNFLPRTAAQDASYTNPDDDPRGPWKAGDFTAQYNPVENPRESQLYSLMTPAGRKLDPPAGRCWLYTEPRYQQLLADNRVWFGPDGTGRPALKRFRSEVMDGRVPETWWTYQEVGHNQDGKKEIKSLFSFEEPFTTPKPERLLERIIHIGTHPGDLVLDVFAGSGTTAAVAHKMGRRWIACELIEDTVERFTRPRLKKVTNDEDPGGISFTKGERIDASDDGLPEGLSAQDAQALTSLLNKAIADYDDLKKDPSIKRLKALTKTRKAPDTINWRGGGGFHTATLAPALFDYDPELGLITLTEAANDPELLTQGAAAHLRFRLTPDHLHFDGVRGRMRLLVRQSAVSADTVRLIASQLPDCESVTIAAPVILDGARQALRETARGSRILHIPDDLFSAREEG